MIYEIGNEHLKVKISSDGAELMSIKKTNEDIEYLWQGNPDIWECQAPLLFPVIGRLRGGKYEYENNTFKMPIHGFAKDSEFSVSVKKDASIEFILQYSKDTLKVYPFKFRLHVIYMLEGSSIIKKHIIENTGEDVMYYELGGHEGYNLNDFSGASMEECYVEFPGSEGFYKYVIDENVMITDKKKKIRLDKNRLNLSPELFNNDALITDSLKTRTVIIKNIKNKRTIKVTFNSFKYLGIWTIPQNSGFICIEPWSSLPECNYTDNNLKNKVNILRLEKSKKHELSYTITVG